MRQTDRQTGRQADGQRQTDRQTDREGRREGEREKGRERGEREGAGGREHVGTYSDNCFILMALSLLWKTRVYAIVRSRTPITSSVFPWCLSAYWTFWTDRNLLTKCSAMLFGSYE